MHRDRLFSTVKTLYPEGIARRKQDMQRHRGQYIVPGPNFIWSIDGHLKFAFCGIEIYAAIDAYSQYIPRFYCGISGRTSVSVAKQYLEVLREVGKQPRFLRSDRGTKTMMCANTHWQLSRSHDPEKDFKDCFMYGTSTANQRIEAWWSQLNKGQLVIWRVSCCYLDLTISKLIIIQDYFEELRNLNQLSDSIADQIACLAIYILILRTVTHGFIRLWNKHTIRRQKNQPNLPVGKPYMLYHYPEAGVTDFAIEPDKGLLETLDESMKEYGLFCQHFI